MASCNITKDDLCHYGIKGMKWGVRRNNTANQKVTINSPISSISKETINAGSRAISKALTHMPPNIQLFGHKKYSNGRAQRMPKEISELMTHESNAQREQLIFEKNIGDYKYTVLNRPGDTPIILNKKKITSTIHDKKR